ncbi:hypothetical protein [Gorillibacterium sp. sgz5001074]|uniref:hypothetical protein n=1 Tax=Gorillibacterium sp. sgz5001074 TaxID=3446695 RepID=UPI003F668E88
MVKSKVIPVKVPWMISPSFDFSSFVGDDEGDVSVRVICNFNEKTYDEEISKLQKQYGEDIPDDEYNKAGSSMIEINFTPRCLFNIYGKIDGYERYDFSICDQYYYGGVSLSHEWNHSGICPNPGFYEVVDSNLNEIFGFTSPKVKHWLLCGHDSCIDVLAYSFEWKILEW